METDLWWLTKISPFCHIAAKPPAAIETEKIKYIKELKFNEFPRENRGMMIIGKPSETSLPQV